MLPPGTLNALKGHQDGIVTVARLGAFDCDRMRGACLGIDRGTCLVFRDITSANFDEGTAY
jgi:hypothetical protein